MFLGLVDARDVTTLIGRKHAVDVLLQNLEVAGDCVQRRPKLVTETSEKFGLDAIRGFRVLARGLLAFQSDLELASALRHTRIQRPVQRVHALLGREANARISEEPADRAFSGER